MVEISFVLSAWIINEFEKLVLRAAICTKCSRTQKLNFTIGKHFRDKYYLVPRDLTKNFSVIKKCTNEFECLHYEMFFIQELRRALNVRSVSIGARFLILIKFLILISNLVFNWLLIISSLGMFLLSVYTSEKFYTS